MSESLHSASSIDQSISQGTKYDDEEEQSTPVPLCFVLNLVFDYILRPPSPLEKLEFNKKEIFEVPIIRIFGPLFSSPNSTSGQSACLYIHNAFPYIIARPRREYFEEDSLEEGWWTDHEADLADLLPHVIISIEESMKSSMILPSSFASDSVKYIRQVTLVKGREFYSYTPFPPCLFLKIEYYNPSHRWRIKFILEKGLEIVNISETDGNIVPFHCYEAHIPYSMQFFKDYNLAGMKHVKIGPVEFDDENEEESHCFFFRNPLPQKCPLQHDKDDCFLFDDSSVPHELCWNTDEKENSTSNNYWNKKESSCEIEIDIDVSCIFNLFDKILKSEKNIHWRAVPSLQELWVDEKVRMQKLLPPEFDFLNNPTSNSKKNSRSGSEQALKGIYNLIHEDLRDDYYKAVNDIIQRHKNDIDLEDEELLKTWFQRKKNNSKSIKNESSEDPDFLDVLNALGMQFDTHNQKEESTLQPHLSQKSNSTRVTFPNVKTTMSQTSVIHRSNNKMFTDDDWNFAKKVEGEKDNLLDDLIDPETLTPYDDEDKEDDDNHELEEDGFVKELLQLSKEKKNENQTNVDYSSLYTQDFDINVNLFEEEFKYDDNISIHSIHSDTTSSQINNKVEAVDAVEFENSGNTADDLFTTDDTGAEFSTIDESDTELLSHKLFCINGNKYIINNQSRLKNENKFLQPKLKISPPSRSSCKDISKIELYPTSMIGKFNHGEEQNHKKFASDRYFLPWLKFSGQFHKWVASFMDFSPKKKNSIIDLVEDKTKLYQLHPVRLPPNRKQIEYWLKKEKKRKEFLAKETNNKNNKKNNEDDLVIDSNSRKMTVKDNHIKNKKSKRGQSLEIQEIFDSELHQKSSGNLFSPAEGSNFGLSCLSHTQMNQHMSQSSFSHAQSSQFTSPAKSIKSEIQRNAEPKGKGKTEKEAKFSQSSIDSQTNPSSPSELIKQDPEITKNKSNECSSDPINDTPFSKSIHPLGSSEETIFASLSQQFKKKTEPLGVTGGAMKAKTGVPHPEPDTNRLSKEKRTQPPSPLLLMSIEIHVQCRTGRAGTNDSREIAMKPDSSRDEVSSVAYVLSEDPGEGESLKVIERGCIFVPVEKEVEQEKSTASVPFVKKTTGISRSRIKMERVQTEKKLLLRFASIVQWHDPDALISWDTQGLGIGYLVERGNAMGNENKSDMKNQGQDETSKTAPIEMVRLLGRTPKIRKYADEGNKKARPNKSNESLFQVSEDGTEWRKKLLENSKATNSNENQFKGSGLGTEWDEMVGAGVAASSIVGRLILCGWKMTAEEVKHPNYSYQPAMVATVLQKRLPYHDDMVLLRWYAADGGRERHRVLEYRLAQAWATLLIFDALDIIGRAGEAARLSGVEFSQSFPGIRGSQYKVEGVLLRALQSVWSDERGSKKGSKRSRLCTTYSEDNSGPDSMMTTNTMSFKSHGFTPWKIKRSLGNRIFRTEDTPSQESDKNETISSRGYFFFSPSREDCHRQEALECQAMTLEPQSGFIYDPVVVCDFTALYPSLVIAYNLCYTTCFGKLDYHSTRREMRQEGRTTGKVGPLSYPERYTAATLKHHFKSSNNKNMTDRAYVAPTGSLYVSENVLKGVLPQVLKEMLETRAMIKKALKAYSRNVKNISTSILRQLEARQLALKYVANVTYGYTSATFSGRSAMPLLADTIVECGRRTLKNAIDLANSWGREKKGRWKGAEVVYGDTDSLFIKLPGRTIKEAFMFGEEFCKYVTASNPAPIELKLEKVYGATMLQTKKKYCGMKFDSSDQNKPTFEAKGIETVRRDQCSLTQKILRNSLIITFRRGISESKRYLFRQWALIHAGRIPISDFILTGRVRTRYRNNSIGPVQAALAKRLVESDPGRVIRHKERLPYVIVAAPGIQYRLRDCVLTPMELLEQWDAYTIHSSYYITKHVNAALQRCLCLKPYEIDVHMWYNTFPKPKQRIHAWPVSKAGGSTMISSYFGSDICSLCGIKCVGTGGITRTSAAVCFKCKNDKDNAALVALLRLNRSQKQAMDVAKICSSCNGSYESSETFAREREYEKQKYGSFVKKDKLSSGVITPLANCVCIDCPVTYQRHRAKEAEIEAKALCQTLDLF